MLATFPYGGTGAYISRSAVLRLGREGIEHCMQYLVCGNMDARLGRCLFSGVRHENNGGEMTDLNCLQDPETGRKEKIQGLSMHRIDGEKAYQMEKARNVLFAFNKTDRSVRFIFPVFFLLFHSPHMYDLHLQMCTHLRNENQFSSRYDCSTR